MTGARILVSLVAVAVLGGCSADTVRDEAAPAKSDACASIHQEAMHQADALSDATEEMQELEETGQLEPVPIGVDPGDDPGGDEWWFEGATQAGPGANLWSALRLKAVEAARLWARIIVNNQDCFSATDVAKAQEWLEQVG